MASVGIEFKSKTTPVIEKKTQLFIENLPHIEEETASEIADDLKEAIEDSIDRKFGNFTGDLRENVKARRAGSTSDGAKFEVTANAYSEDGVNYAAWHEYAEGSHFVPFTQSNAPIQAWARQNNINAWGITVTPMNQQEGSFMAPAVQKAIKKARRTTRSGKSPTSTGLRKVYG